MVARRAPAAAVAARNQSTSMVGPTFWAAVAARIKNNVVRGLGAARGGRMNLHGWSWYFLVSYKTLAALCFALHDASCIFEARLAAQIASPDKKLASTVRHG